MNMFQGRSKWQGEEHPWFKRHSLSLVLIVLMPTSGSGTVW